MHLSGYVVAAMPYVLSVQVRAWLQEGKDVRLGDWSAREIEILNSWQLLTAKPAVYLVNMSAKVGAVQPVLPGETHLPHHMPWKTV